MTITDKQEEQINTWFSKNFADPDKFDLFSELDRNITVEENKRIIKEKYQSNFIGQEKDTLTAVKESIVRENIKPSSYSENKSKLFTEPNNFLVIGKKGSGKTALGFKFMEAISTNNKKAFVFRFPKPELLSKLPFKVENINNMKELYNLTDSVCLIDEAHRYFDVLNKMVNEDLKILLANSRQNNNSFIFITHNSYFITRGLFTYIDCRIIKEVNEGHWNTDRPHMKALYSDTYISGAENFFIDSDCWRGNENFILPIYYTEDFSNAYKHITTERKDFFADVCGSFKLSKKVRKGAE